MRTYRAAVIGCSRMGGFIDNEVRGDPFVVLPYSHAAGYTTCERTELVACADSRPDRGVMAEFGRQYGIPPEHQYTDYRAMIERERPDIVSVATQPEPRAEIVIYAAEHGVKAVYAEKAMAASLADAQAMVAAVERHGLAFNLGTNRRWDPGFDAVKAMIDSGALGQLKSILIYNTGSLFNTASHYFDLALWLNNDQPVTWAQSCLQTGDGWLEGDVLREDPVGHGHFQFANGVTTYALLTPRGGEYEVVCEGGSITCLNNGREWQVRRMGRNEQGRPTGLVSESFPQFERASSTLRLIEDLVHALDTGEPTRGGVRAAYTSTELIFAFIESHRRGGARIELPLTASSIRLARQTTPRAPVIQ
ncbi:MAG: Gfo/Idh/MocA family oxidoreductase [Anaerolineae bacterium]|nr:Gfo/Idh/MocA family oxidoreductase [Anaerolineae bacterium]